MSSYLGWLLWLAEDAAVGDPLVYGWLRWFPLATSGIILPWSGCCGWLWMRLLETPRFQSRVARSTVPELATPDLHPAPREPLKVVCELSRRTSFEAQPMSLEAPDHDPAPATCSSEKLHSGARMLGLPPMTKVAPDRTRVAPDD